MLQLFRNNQFTTALFVPFYFAIFGVNIWLYPNDNLASFWELPSTLSHLILGWIGSPLANKICFSILILFQAFFLNAIINFFKLTKQGTFIPAVCFILLHFSYPDIDSCSPVMLANTFMLWALYSLFASYEKRVSLGTIFNIGFSVALASLFYHGCIVYFLWIILGLLIIRSFDAQEFILLIAGFFVPFFLLGTYHFLGNNLNAWLANDLWVHYSTMNIHYDTDTFLYILLGVLVVPFLLGLGNLQGLYFKTTTREKKFINVVFLMPIIGLLSFFFQNNLYCYHYLTFFIPISILLGITLQSYKSLAAAEAVHFVLFMLCMGVQYRVLFFG